MNEETKDLEVFNKFCITFGNRRINILNPPFGPMSEDDALILAAWLVAVAGDKERFEEIYKKVIES